MKNKNIIETIGTIIVLLIIVACCLYYPFLSKDKVTIDIDEYNTLLACRDELQMYYSYASQHEENRDDTEVEGATFDEIEGLYVLPQTEYQMIQYNILQKCFHKYDNLVLYHSTVSENDYKAIYEVYYDNLKEEYEKHRYEIEDELNKLCASVREEWVANGKYKDVYIKALDYNNAERVYYISLNGKPFSSIYDEQRRE